MFAQYFGQFLLNQNMITTSELEKALEAQKLTRVKLGVLAINRGVMTAEQVEAVHQAQTSVDKRFGELAIEMGFIEEPLINDLLSAQPSAHLALGQALIDHEIMSYETFSSALFQYKQENSLSDDQFQAIVSGSIEALLESKWLKAGMTADTVTIDYISLFAKNLIRFIDTQTRLEIVAVHSQAYDWVAEQLIQSENYMVERTTAIAGSESNLVRFGSRYATEEINGPGEMMEAAVGEFLNLHNGIYLVNRSNQGSELNMLPQQVIRAAQFTASSPMKTIIEVIGSDFNFHLILTELSDLFE